LLTEICQTAYADSVQHPRRFDERLMQRIKAEAAQQGMSVTKYIEAALRDRLRRSHTGPKRARPIKLPVSRATGGLASGVDNFNQAAALTDNAEAIRLFRATVSN
jgi:hypothetical protein